MSGIDKKFENVLNGPLRALNGVEETNKEAEKEAVEKMSEYAENHNGTEQYEYLVRGATLVCDKGSHKRKLNLPKCHGVYVGVHPVLHELECLTESQVGLSKCNISFFGVCEQELPAGTDIVMYGMTKTNSRLGVEGPVMGYKCRPEIVGVWNDTYSDTQIIDNKDAVGRMNISVGGETISARSLLTTNSFLVCKYGGLIQPIDSGQGYEVTPDDFYNLYDYNVVTRDIASNNNDSDSGTPREVEKNENVKLEYNFLAPGMENAQGDEK